MAADVVESEELREVFKLILVLGNFLNAVSDSSVTTHATPIALGCRHYLTAYKFALQSIFYHMEHVGNQSPWEFESSCQLNPIENWIELGCVGKWITFLRCTLVTNLPSFEYQ